MESAVILPPDYVPSPDEEYMNDLQVEYFRQKLLAWKKSLLNQSQDTLEDLRQGGLNQPDDIEANRYRTSFYNRFFRRFKAPESWFYPGALLKDKTKMFIGKSNCDVGVFVNRGFVKASNVIVVVDSEKDLFLLAYASTLLKTTHGSVSILDRSSSTTPGSEKIKHAIRQFVDTTKQASLLADKDMTAAIFSNYNFMLISYDTWNDVSEHRREALQKMPSTLIMNHKEK